MNRKGQDTFELLIMLFWIVVIGAIGFTILGVMNGASLTMAFANTMSQNHSCLDQYAIHFCNQEGAEFYKLSFSNYHFYCEHLLTYDSRQSLPLTKKSKHRFLEYELNYCGKNYLVE